MFCLHETLYVLQCRSRSGAKITNTAVQKTENCRPYNTKWMPEMNLSWHNVKDRQTLGLKNPSGHNVKDRQILGLKNPSRHNVKDRQTLGLKTPWGHNVKDKHWDWRTKADTMSWTDKTVGLKNPSWHNVKGRQIMGLKNPSWHSVRDRQTLGLISHFQMLLCSTELYKYSKMPLFPSVHTYSNVSKL